MSHFDSLVWNGLSAVGLCTVLWFGFVCCCKVCHALKERHDEQEAALKQTQDLLNLKAKWQNKALEQH